LLPALLTKNKMKHIQTLSLIIVIGILISACGGTSAVSTVDPASIQSTVAAAAFTLMAETQAALPTTTPIPPTETLTQTPLPTNTPVVLATETLASLPTTQVAAPNTPTAVPDTATDECNKPISGFSGPETTIRVVNNTGQPIGVWLQVGKTPFGDCGYAVIPPIQPGGDYSFLAPQGCYAAGAWTTGDKKLTIDNVRYPLCINNSDKWTLVIKKDIIYLNPP
jgi:hypothetical protein